MRVCALAVAVACAVAAACGAGVNTQAAESIPALRDSGLLWLVSPDFPLPEDYSPGDMTAYGQHQMRDAAARAFSQMQDAMADAGVRELELYSAYRSHERQAYLFAQKVKYLISRGFPESAARAQAAQIVQPAGASEHQSGLALDVSTTGQLTQDFGETCAGIWLAEHAQNYGFVIRYPRAKTHTTHITYEPWHLRYVGVPHAQILTERGMVLEEYAAFLARHTPFTYYADLGETYVIELVCTPPLFPCPAIIDISAAHCGTGAWYVITTFLEGLNGCPTGGGCGAESR